MQVQKLVATTTEQEVEVEDVLVLSKEEYEENEDIIPIHDDNWWLRTSYPYASSSPMVYVAPCKKEGSNTPEGRSIRCTSIGISPALRIKNLEATGLERGDRIEIAGFKFTIINGIYAQCDEIVGYSFFRKNYKSYNAVDWTVSDLRKWLYKWAESLGIKANITEKTDQKWMVQTIYHLIEKGRTADEMKNITNTEWDDLESFVDDKLASTWQSYPEVKPIIDDDYLVHYDDNSYAVDAWEDGNWTKTYGNTKVESWMDIPEKEYARPTKSKKTITPGSKNQHEADFADIQMVDTISEPKPVIKKEPEPEVTEEIQAEEVVAETKTVDIEPELEQIEIVEETIPKPEAEPDSNEKKDSIASALESVVDKSKTKPEPEPMPAKEPIKVKSLADIMAEQTAEASATTSEPESEAEPTPIPKPEPINDRSVMDMDAALASADGIKDTSVEEEPIVPGKPTSTKELVIPEANVSEKNLEGDISEIIDVPKNTVQTDFDANNVLTRPIGAKSDNQIVFDDFD